MAKLKTLKIKDKKFVFTSYENDKAVNPAYVVFARFPQEDEVFFTGDRKNLFENIDFSKAGTEKGKKEFMDAFLENYLNNLRANNIDYEAFLRECVSEFHDFEFEGGKIKTVDDFLGLPDAAARRIAVELYAYARREDKFSMGESKA
jgi:hypothetical protein